MTSLRALESPQNLYPPALILGVIRPKTISTCRMTDAERLRSVPGLGGSLGSCRLVTGHDLGRHQSDVIHAGRSRDIDDFSNVSEVDIVVALDEHDPLGAIGIDLG